MRKYRDIFYIIIFLAFTVAVWTAIQAMPGARSVRLPAANGFYDLTNNDFENTVYHIAENWESYPEKLYAPEDFDNGSVTETPILPQVGYHGSVPYITYRMRLDLPPGQTYGILMTTGDHSMRLFIDGDEIDSVGVPGETRESTVPQVREKFYCFTSASGTVAFTVQTSSFVHAKGCRPPAFTIGSFENIARQSTNETAAAFVLIGCLLTSFLYHLGLFLLNRTRKNVLLFAVCCLLLALLSKKWFFVFFPDYNWFGALRFEYVVHFATFAVLTLFLDTLSPKLLHRFVTRPYYALAGLYALATLLLDTYIFSGLLLYFEIASVGMIFYILTRLAMALRGKTIQGALSFAGMLVICLFGLNDILYYRGVGWALQFGGRYFMTPIGMAFFVFCFALVLSIEYAETEAAMIDAREKEHILTAENAALDRVNLLKTDLMRTISHETRTPLAVIMGFAEITAEDARKSGLDGETAANLDAIAAEAGRMADMMEEMRRLALAREYEKDRRSVDIGAVIRRIAGLYGKVLERKGTVLKLNVADGIPPVCGNVGELTQVLFNLLRNADAHTEKGMISIDAEASDGFVKVTVRDTGTGIPPELLPHVFERGVHGAGGGTGLGLAVCRDIITACGGEIRIESGANGTAAIFALPPCEERKEGVSGE
jgi:signal transduction histidine kinase